MKIRTISLASHTTYRLVGDYVKTGGEITVELADNEDVRVVTRKALRELERICGLVLLQNLKGTENIIEGSRDDTETIIKQLEKKYNRRKNVKNSK